MKNTLKPLEKEEKTHFKSPQNITPETLKKNPNSIKIPSVQISKAFNLHQNMNVTGITLVQPVLKKIQTAEYAIFDDIYDKYTTEKKWKQRKRPEKIRRIKENHVFIKLSNQILGGFTPLEKENNWAELTNLWSFKEGNGIGTIMIKEAKKQYSKIFLFCKASNQATIKFFKKRGFMDLGTNLENADIEDFIKNTPHSEGAHLFIWKK